jgi:hypothetical protein
LHKPKGGGAPAWPLAIIVSTVMESAAPTPHALSMETKDNFMRFVVIGSILAVGALAVIVRMHA